MGSQLEKFWLSYLQVDETDTVKRSEVTQIEVRGAAMAVGYHDGSVRLFDTETGDSEVRLDFSDFISDVWLIESDALPYVKPS